MVYIRCHDLMTTNNSFQNAYYRSESENSNKSDSSNTQSESDDHQKSRGQFGSMISMDVIDLDDLRKSK